MNRYFVYITLAQGAAIGWIVATAVNALTAVAALTANIVGLVAACAYLATLYVSYPTVEFP